MLETIEAEVEIGTFEEVLLDLQHPYTTAQLGSVHLLRRAELEERFLLRGEMPSPRKPPPGCTFTPGAPSRRSSARKNIRRPRRSRRGPSLPVITGKKSDARWDSNDVFFESRLQYLQ